MVATTGITFISAMQTTRSMSPQFSSTAWITGALGRAPSAASWAKAGVSSTLRRMMKPMTITTKLSRNGTRQPHALKLSSSM